MITETHLTSTAACNLHMLVEYESILSNLAPEQYRYTRSPVFTSSVGAHLRHDLDHYINFLSGIESGEIDYEKRTRNPDIELQTEHALELIHEIIGKLESLEIEDTPLAVHLENSDGPVKKTKSNIQRELDFLLSHTIHHQAIISMILRDQQLTPNASFGVAPSTLRHQASCAQ